MSPVDAEDLIAQLSGGLTPVDRASFRRAAENALATEPQCLGEGSVHRTITRLWRQYFHPPDTRESSWYEQRNRPASKLLSEDAPQARRYTRNLRVME